LGGFSSTPCKLQQLLQHVSQALLAGAAAAALLGLLLLGLLLLRLVLWQLVIIRHRCGPGTPDNPACKQLLQLAVQLLNALPH
jgi:hypothetical protein